MIAHGPSWLSTLKGNDLVWLDSQNLKLSYESKKISSKCKGPFCILERLGPLTYRLELLPEWNIHPVFNVALLKPYHETTEHSLNNYWQMSKYINRENLPKVEKILAYQSRGQGT